MECIKFTFTAVAGDELLQVELANPNGIGDNMSFHIMIDNYYHGVIFRQNGQWVCYPNKQSWLQQEDITILGEIIDERLTENKKAP
jgi:hypothetical protein